MQTKIRSRIQDATSDQGIQCLKDHLFHKFDRIKKNVPIKQRRLTCQIDQDGNGHSFGIFGLLSVNLRQKDRQTLRITILFFNLHYVMKTVGGAKIHVEF